MLAIALAFSLLASLVYASSASASPSCAVQSNFISGNLSYSLSSDCTAAITGKVSGTSLTAPPTVNYLGDVYSVTSVADNAFISTDATDIDLSAATSLTYIGRKAFSFTTSLANIKLPNSVTRFEEESFSYSWGLRSLNFPTSLVTIGRCAFCSAGLSVLDMSASTSLLYIPVEGFAYMGLLTRVIFPDSLQSIDVSAFTSDGNLSDINIPPGLISIGANAFFSTGLTHAIVLPASVTYLGNNAFGTGAPLDITIMGDVQPFLGYTPFPSASTVRNCQTAVIWSNYNYISECTLSFDSQMGTSESPQTVAYGGSFSEPTSTPVRTGYLFRGWFTSSSGGSQVHFPLAATSQQNVYAQWEASSPAAVPSNQSSSNEVLAFTGINIFQELAISLLLVSSGIFFQKASKPKRRRGRHCYSR